MADVDQQTRDTLAAVKREADHKKSQREIVSLLTIGVILDVVFLYLWGTTGFYIALALGVVVWTVYLLARRKAKGGK